MAEGQGERLGDGGQAGDRCQLTLRQLPTAHQEGGGVCGQHSSTLGALAEGQQDSRLHRMAAYR